MFFHEHVEFLWNGGLDPVTANPVALRERRTRSTTIALMLPIAFGLIVANLYTDQASDNLYIAAASLIFFCSLYLLAYTNQQLLASQAPILSIWLLVCLSMTAVGLWGNTWAWLLCLPAIASIVAGRIVGLVWAVICVITLWGFALLQSRGFEFGSNPLTAGPEPLGLAFECSLVLTFLTAATFVFRSGQVAAEKKLSATVDQLEQEVHDRTHAENDARQSEQAKSKFLEAIGYELRTPLSSVIGASQLLQGGELPAKKRELVDVILQSSETLVEMVNNVLDLSSLDSDTIELESVPVNLRKLLNSMMAPLSFQANEKGVKFSMMVSDDMPAYIEADPVRLRQIFLNVVGNAVKFTDSGEIIVLVDIALERIRIKVEDTGIGISKNAQASLFEPYVQAEVSKIRKLGGSGLGLNIVKRLVTAMEGKIVVNSVPGRGSTFTIFLPLKTTAAHHVKSDKSEDQELPSLSIVTVDDNAINRMVLSRMLEQDGHEVVAMANGKEVVDYLPNHDVSVILMDLQMPVMDGMATLKKIRAMPGTLAKTPVIAVTANVMNEAPEELIAMGMNGYLRKPYRREELRNALHKALAPKFSAPS